MVVDMGKICPDRRHARRCSVSLERALRHGIQSQRVGAVGCVGFHFSKRFNSRPHDRNSSAPRLTLVKIYLTRDARKNKGMPRPLVGPRRRDLAGLCLPILTPLPRTLIRRSCNGVQFARAPSTDVFRITVNSAATFTATVVSVSEHRLEQHHKSIASQNVVPASGQHCVPWSPLAAAGKAEDLSGEQLGNDCGRAFGHVRKSSRCRARDHGACIELFPRASSLQRAIILVL